MKQLTFALLVILSSGGAAAQSAPASLRGLARSPAGERQDRDHGREELDRVRGDDPGRRVHGRRQWRRTPEPVHADDRPARPHRRSRASSTTTTTSSCSASAPDTTRGSRPRRRLPTCRRALKARAKTVPAGEFITAMGGWNPAQFAEKRLPTLAELDAADAGPSGDRVPVVHRARGDEHARRRRSSPARASR